MPTFTLEQTNAVRAAALFAADKFRKAYEILDRFADDNAGDVRFTCNEFTRIANMQNLSGGELSPGQFRLLDQAFSGYLRDMNRRLQIVSARCDSEGETLLRNAFVEATGAAALVTTAMVAAETVAVEGGQ